MAQKTVLIVDDEDDILQIMEKRLLKFELRVLKAHDGNEAMKKLTETQIELVITDIKMPGKDGTQLITEIRSHPQLKSIPVIVVSGHMDEHNVKQILVKDTVNLIMKPFNGKKFDLLVKECLKLV